ncbi:hypothetical protein PQX77_019136 [Marasmius sp. AFHP31]|nr:hypothetical protein PQX77_019136 [Marasmius sp. AFHP31]
MEKRPRILAISWYLLNSVHSCQIVEVLQLNLEYVEVFGWAQPGNDLNNLKSKTTSDIPALNLDPHKPGGSHRTAIELISENELNLESLQNTPFANVVLPWQQNDNPPFCVRLAENPWDVALMDPKKVRLVQVRCTGAFVSTPFAGQLLERAVEVMLASYNRVMGEQVKHLWKKEIKKDRGLITEHNKDGLFALALTKGKGMTELREQILQTPIGPNFNEFNHYQLSHSLCAHGIFNIEYWTTCYAAEGPFDYDKESIQEDGVSIPMPVSRRRKLKKAKKVVQQEVMDAETNCLWRDLRSKRQKSVIWNVLELDSLNKVDRCSRGSQSQPRVQRQTVVIPPPEHAESSSGHGPSVVPNSSTVVNLDPFPTITIQIPP